MAKTAQLEARQEGLVAQVKSWPDATRNFYSEVRNEMRKVTTPPLKEVRATTAVVIITVFIFGIYFYAVDAIIGGALEWVLAHGAK